MIAPPLLQASEMAARRAVIQSMHRKRLARAPHHAGLTRSRVCGTIAAVSAGGAERGCSAALGGLAATLG
jgi:hypothetical protein